MHKIDDFRHAENHVSRSVIQVASHCPKRYDFMLSHAPVRSQFRQVPSCEASSVRWGGAWGLDGIDISYSMLRNGASGPLIGLPGRILAGLLPIKYRTRPSGRLSAGRRSDFGAFPVADRPKTGPDGRLTARMHYCVTQSRRDSGSPPIH